MNRTRRWPKFFLRPICSRVTATIDFNEKKQELICSQKCRVRIRVDRSEENFPKLILTIVKMPQDDRL